MKIEKNKVAEYNGKDIYLFRLLNSSGHFVECINYGATLTRICAFGIDNLVLSYPKIEDYFSDPFYLGCTVGRVANRISNGEFQLDGTIYKLRKNDGNNTNHGGDKGFNKKVFDAEIQDDKVVFRTFSPDGEEGFPGNLSVKVSYSFTGNNELIIEYELTTDKKTPVNLTNHSYFNLTKEKNVLNHFLKVYSDKFLEMDESFLPTGKIVKITENPGFDFFNFRKIGEKAAIKNETHIQGYNAYFPIQDKNSLKKAAILICPKSGIELTLFTSMPGFMLYTGDYLGNPFASLQGVCLEAHHYPDAVNHPAFPQCWLESGETRREIIVYSISNHQK